MEHVFIARLSVKIIALKWLLSDRAYGKIPWNYVGTVLLIAVVHNRKECDPPRHCSLLADFAATGSFMSN